MWQVRKKQRYRFSLLMNELRGSDNDDYKSHIMAFINCLILANDDIVQRTTVRNEFIGTPVVHSSFDSVC